jgi:uncharacterized membrane protein
MPEFNSFTWICFDLEDSGGVAYEVLGISIIVIFEQVVVEVSGGHVSGWGFNVESQIIYYY